MNKQNIRIWGREFQMDVQFDCYTGEEVLESQREAAAALAATEPVIEAALEKVKAYCLSLNRQEIGADKIENIFKYVAPKYLYVPRTEGKHVVAIMCNYKFDQEHGIAVVFEDERFARIGKQEIIL